MSHDEPACLVAAVGEWNFRVHHLDPSNLSLQVPTTQADATKFTEVHNKIMATLCHILVVSEDNCFGGATTDFVDQWTENRGRQGQGESC